MRSSSEWKVTTTSRPPGLRIAFRGRAAPRASSLELAIDGDAQRLEGAGRRVDVAAASTGSRAPQMIGELARCAGTGRCCRGRRRWRGRAPRPCAPRHRAGRCRRASPRRGVLTRSAALRPCGLHAHVERAVLAEREAALGLVELHRGDADVEARLRRPPKPSERGDLVETGEAVLDRAVAARHRRDQAHRGPTMAPGRGRWPTTRRKRREWLRDGRRPRRCASTNSSPAWGASAAMTSSSITGTCRPSSRVRGRGHALFGQARSARIGRIPPVSLTVDEGLTIGEHRSEADRAAGLGRCALAPRRQTSEHDDRADHGSEKPAVSPARRGGSPGRDRSRRERRRCRGRSSG